MSDARVALGAHHQTGTLVNGTTGTGTEMRATANAGTARAMGIGRPTPHVPRILISPALVTLFMEENTVAMMMPVPGTTAEKTGIATAIEIEIEIETRTETETGIGIADTTDDRG